MPNNPQYLPWLRGPIVDPNTGHPSPEFQRWISDLDFAASKTVTRPRQVSGGSPVVPGQLQSLAVIVGRTEPIGTTVTNITSAGTFNSLGNVVDTSTDHLTDGTGTPLLGGKRGAIALDSHNRLTGSRNSNPVNVTSFFTGANPLSQSGATTTILVAASTRKIGDGTSSVSYNSGSVDPGSLGGKTVFISDPTFAGGAVSYQATTSNQNLSNAQGAMSFGSITTVGGGGASGSGGGDAEFPPQLL